MRTASGRCGCYPCALSREYLNGASIRGHCTRHGVVKKRFAGMFGVVLLLSVVCAIASFLQFRAYAVSGKKLWIAAGIAAACVCLAGIIYGTATLLLITAIP